MTSINLAWNLSLVSDYGVRFFRTLIYWQFFKAGGDNHSNSYGNNPLSGLDVNSDSVTSRGTNKCRKNKFRN